MNINDTFKQPDFIKLQANDLVRTEFYTNRAVYADGDDFLPIRYDRVTLPLITLRANALTNEIGVYKVHTYEKYDKSFYEFCQRAKAGRKTEQLVYYWLTQAGVVANLKTMRLDGDKSVKAPDITVRAAQPDENDDYQWYSLEVKTTTKEYELYTNDPATFPACIRVDSVEPYDKKRKTSTRNDAPLIGVVKVHSRTGGVLFIPDRTRDSWYIKPQNNTWKSNDSVYWANRDCFRSFNTLVEKLGGKLS